MKFEYQLSSKLKPAKFACPPNSNIILFARVIPLTFVDSPHHVSTSNILTKIGMGILIIVKQSTIATLAGFILVPINLYQFFSS